MMNVYKPISEWHRRYDLTPEKIYDCEWNGKMVYSSDGVYYKLINDTGHEIEVHSSHFVRLDDVRQKKLEMIL